ncbi:MAG TPA: response regulator transcription factor [Bryobacteraceae bacterium]|nr:response regulator transcription factor [Bryobacteraceae bacterium]
MALNLLLADGHKVVRDGLKAILSRDPDFRVIGETESGREAVQICKTERPHIAILEIGLADLNGFETTTEILRYSPETKVVVLTMLEEELAMLNAIRCGARGFVLKRVSAQELLEALRAVARGGVYLSPSISQRLVDRMQNDGIDERPMASRARALSPRELQVLRLIAEGNTSKEIAQLLALSLETVRTYRKTMMKKLGVGNVAGLTQVALSTGLTRVGSSGSVWPTETAGTPQELRRFKTQEMVST